ncbi:MAG: 3-phosphoserine/phosphohydroxythreonine transaminase [Gammaproteobacteria bacterium]|nr:3-phosphoserine/phosphohydroxythreonine transaminase [Gammaproteobacteria bacterium]
MTRATNFSAGPAAVPFSVLERVQAELLDWRGGGASVMEVSHRGRDFMEMAAESEAKLRRLMAIPDNYRVLFLQGGATLQFSAVPMNLAPNGAKANYLCTGSWSKKAITEAQKACDVHVVATTEDGGFRSIPAQDSWDIHPDGAYFHYTPNETISGVEFHWVPDDIGQPLVADMSSTILSRPVAVDRFGVIYAGAQKNMGIAGLTVVLVREDLLGNADSRTPAPIDYTAQAKADSMDNTPSAFAWYVANLVFDWAEEQGGLSAIGEVNQRKASKLYAAIDGSNFYTNDVEISARSWMNVTFTLADAELDKAFLAKAESAGLLGLKGHRLVGGMRASIYNAMPESGIDELIALMSEFERTHG